MTRQTLLDFLLDLAALAAFAFLIYADKLTPGEGLPPLLLIMGVKTASQLKGGPRSGGVATVLALLAAVAASAPAVAAATTTADADVSGEHRQPGE